MGVYVKSGGFVVTTPDKNYVYPEDGRINQATLRRIAEILGIPTADIEKLAAESIRTIFVYGPAKS
jgi:beta-galactosidase GanA